MHLLGWVNTLLSLKHVIGPNTILGSAMCNEYLAEKLNFFWGFFFLFVFFRAVSERREDGLHGDIWCIMVAQSIHSLNTDRFDHVLFTLLQTLHYFKKVQITNTACVILG